MFDELKSIDRPIFGAFLSGDNIYNTKKVEDSVLVIGNESQGISPELETLITNKITIPQFGASQETESLNAAVATGILLSEFKGH